MDKIELLEAVKKYLASLDSDERYEVMVEICGGYCLHCGKDWPCHCWNDE